MNGCPEKAWLSLRIWTTVSGQRSRASRISSSRSVRCRGVGRCCHGWPATVASAACWYSIFHLHEARNVSLCRCRGAHGPGDPGAGGGLLWRRVAGNAAGWQRSADALLPELRAKGRDGAAGAGDPGRPSGEDLAVFRGRLRPGREPRVAVRPDEAGRARRRETAGRAVQGDPAGSPGDGGWRSVRAELSPAGRRSRLSGRPEPKRPRRECPAGTIRQ